MTAIDEIKARLDIVEIVSGYVPGLKKSGRTWKARCPFHSERTPSFTVDPERGTWHCFGACSTGGDVIEFVRRIEGVDFREALRLCAERAGVELHPPSRREVEEREQHERLLQANEAAAVFFQAGLGGPEGAAARAYLEGRGVDAKTAETWQLGFAPAGWRSLTDYLTARGFAEADLVAAGLAIEGDRGAYDRFRHRLVFPTRDARRRLIGFGARALSSDDEPKYLNTPQTPLFDKGATLYGIDRAAEEIRRAGRSIIVEGYMDVIAAHQFGVANAVASNGTAITERQMALLKRYAGDVVLALDADDAGSEATLRAVEVAGGAADRVTMPVIDWRGLVSYQDVVQADIRVAALPPGEDPDSLIRIDPDRFRRLIEEALPVADHLFHAVEGAIEGDDPRSRSRGLQALLPTVAAMGDPVVRSHYVQRLARLARVDERTIMGMVARGSRQRPRVVARAEEDARPAPQTGRAGAPDGETQILQLLVQRPEARGAGVELDPDIFEDSVNKSVFIAWRERVDIGEQLDELEGHVRERYEELLGAPLPEYEAKHVREMPRSMARRLRLVRLRERWRPAAADSAAAVRDLRSSGQAVLDAAVETERSGAVPDTPASDVATAAAEFVELSRRRQEIARDEPTTAGRRQLEDGGGMEAGYDAGL